MYDVSTYTTPRDALIAFLSDAAFNCSTRFFARTLTHNQTEPVWRYFFTRRSQRRNGEVVKAAHGIELLYVFGTLVDIPLYQPDPIDLTLSQQIMRYWADLAITGDPDGGSSPRLWTAYDPAKDNTRQLDQNNQMLDGVLTQKCDLLDQIAGRETNHTSWAA